MANQITVKNKHLTPAGIVNLVLSQVVRVTGFSSQEHFDEFEQKFKSCSDSEIAGLFNLKVGIKGWISARGAFLAAIHQEFETRGIAYCATGDSKVLSYKQKVVLKGKRIEVVS